MSTDHVIKAWDLRTNKCIQTITADDWPRSEDPQVAAMVFDESRKRLVTGGRRPFFWEQKLTMMDKSGHRSAVVKAIYNSSFFVVVSVDDSMHPDAPVMPNSLSGLPYANNMLCRHFCSAVHCLVCLCRARTCFAEWSPARPSMVFRVWCCESG